MSAPKITFIGAGSTIFVKNILGDVFHRDALKSAHIALMDLDPDASGRVTRCCAQVDGFCGRVWTNHLLYRSKSSITGC